MKRLFVIIMATTLYAGCSQPFQIRDEIDPVKKIRIYSCYNNHTKTKGSDEIDLNIWILDKGSKNQTTLLVASYHGKKWLSISSGESLIINIDGEILRFKADRESSRSITSNGGVTEFAYYNLDIKILQKIIDGKSVQGRLTGSESAIDFVVTEENKANFKKMVSAL